MAVGSLICDSPLRSTIASGSLPLADISSKTSFAAFPPIAPLSINRIRRASIAGVTRY